MQDAAPENSMRFVFSASIQRIAERQPNVVDFIRANAAFICAQSVPEKSAETGGRARSASVKRLDSAKSESLTSTFTFVRALATGVLTCT